MKRTAEVNDQQGFLFDQGLSDVDAPLPGKMHRFPTPAEKKAALAVMPRTGIQRRQVLDYIARRGYRGATPGEIENDLKIRRSSVCGRVNDLELGGWIQRNGEERVAPQTGAANEVWVLTPKAQKELGR